ncbi:cytochrome P450 3A13-like [Dysidea avara]|uniref:cytochrome P450 3A13-like n=1 Tax=Dysidea avara TaxID=196820 RepID=UPI00332794BE
MIALLFVAVAVCLAILWLWYRHYYEPYFVLKRSIGLPGPTPEMFFGNSRSIVDKGWIECTKQWSERYGPTYLYFIGIQPVIFTQDVDIIHSVFVNKAGHFLERSNLPNMISDEKANDIGGATCYEWKRMHRMLSPLFTSKKVMQMGPLVDVCCARMMKRLDELLHDNDTIDVYKLFGNYTMEAILTIAFGRDVDSQSNEGKRLSECLSMLGGKTSKWGMIGVSTIVSHASWTMLVFRALLKKSPLGQSWSYVRKVAAMMVDERCTNKTKRADILQGMIDLMDDGASKDDLAFNKLEVNANAKLFLFAGSETTRNAISLTCYCLASNHKVQEKAFGEIEKYFSESSGASLYEAVENIPYLEMVVLEGLRHYIPVKHLYRHCIDSCALNDNLLVPKGTLIYVPILHINFIPDYWSNPDAFDPERFDPNIVVNNTEGFLSFGAGPRICLGKRLGLLNIKMGLVSILRKYRLDLANDTNVEIDYSGMATYPKYGVQLKLIPR